MSSPRLVNVRAMLLVGMASILLSTNQTSAADSDGVVVTEIVVTKEVQMQIEKAGAADKPSMLPGTSGWWAGPLLTPADFPLLTVNVDPSDPPDFVVAINGSSYRAGARSFKVVVGTVTIIVERQGKPRCQHTIDVTQSGPNSVSCKL